MPVMYLHVPAMFVNCQTQSRFILLLSKVFQSQLTVNLDLQICNLMILKHVSFAMLVRRR